MADLILFEVSCAQCSLAYRVDSNRGLAMLYWRDDTPRRFGPEPIGDLATLPTRLDECFEHTRERAEADGWMREGDRVTCPRCQAERRKPKCACGQRAEDWWTHCVRCGAAVEHPPESP